MPKSRLPASYSTLRRWTAADAQTVLAALEASGLSVAVFAAVERIDAQRLYFWRKRLQSPSGEAPAPGFIEVLGHAPEHGRVEIVLRSGRVVRVVDSIEADVLRRLVDALEQEAAC